MRDGGGDGGARGRGLLGPKAAWVESQQHGEGVAKISLPNEAHGVA